ncbi:MAG TPA: (deoxy)nucleoside triphosphate pyrophosphohydrolase [Thermoanaerobaculaceae bacterium]|nr:(deoxy)nucleoside triphosphate pyrophosphohydrolase [Thermoanaerobaculaceae bacterium]
MRPSLTDRVPRIVVAAVIRGSDGRYLLGRRLEGSHLGGLWEFPGGGVEPGETPSEALVRELDEELGVAIAVDAPLTFAFHRDAARDVVLLFYRARITGGSPTGRLGQEVAWFAPDALATLPTPPADAELVRFLVASAA